MRDPLMPIKCKAFLVQCQVFSSSLFYSAQRLSLSTSCKNFFKINDIKLSCHCSHPTPPALEYKLVNFDQGDYVRVGVCYPRDVSSFSVVSVIGSTSTTLRAVTSIDQLNNSTGDVYYWD